MKFGFSMGPVISPTAVTGQVPDQGYPGDVLAVSRFGLGSTLLAKDPRSWPLCLRRHHWRRFPGLGVELNDLGL